MRSFLPFVLGLIACISLQKSTAHNVEIEKDDRAIEYYNSREALRSQDYLRLYKDGKLVKEFSGNALNHGKAKQLYNHYLESAQILEINIAEKDPQPLTPHHLPG